jgi:hypothetical protein
MLTNVLNNNLLPLSTNNMLRYYFIWSMAQTLLKFQRAMLAGKNI